MKKIMNANLFEKMVYVCLVMLLVTNCNYDEVLGLDQDIVFPSAIDENYMQNRDAGDYLTISSDCADQWTEKDYIAFSHAVERIGVQFSAKKQMYVFAAPDTRGLNMSDTLYRAVIEMFGNSSKILNSNTKGKRIRRTKTRSEGFGFAIPDCVPAAISHMGRNAPSYSTVTARCYELYPNWIHYGMPGELVGPLINEYADAATYYNMAFCTSMMSSLNNFVMLIGGSHCVNAYECTKIESTLIYYHDYSSTSEGDGVIFESELDKIFPFYADLIFYF